MVQSLVLMASVLNIFVTKLIHFNFLNLQLIFDKASVQLTQHHIESNK